MGIRRTAALALLAGIYVLDYVPIAAAGSQLEKGWTAYERGDYALAARLIRPFAEQGDPEAQYKLGRMHQTGQGVVQNYAEAVKWYRLSAEKSQPFGQNNLGVM